jgi:methionine-rich copper-binding protein CopC
MKKTTWVLSVIWIAVVPPMLAAGQAQSLPVQTSSQAPADNGIGVAPARFELPMSPGAEKTVVVNVIYNSVSGEAQPCRLVASLGDWSILSSGEAEYYKAGTQPNSACAWLTYSPAEITALPGKIHPVRVTVSVPKDATPGDHLAALFVEARPDNLKVDQNRRQVILRFRMAALFYIMVPQLTKKGSLQDLKTGVSEQGILVTPTLKNEGNSHLRPLHSIKILDSAGAVVAELPETESLPVLAGAEMSRPLVIPKSLAAGAYSVRYKIDFKDGSATTEGQTELVVKARPAR